MHQLRTLRSAVEVDAQRRVSLDGTTVVADHILHRPWRRVRFRLGCVGCSVPLLAVLAVLVRLIVTL